MKNMINQKGFSLVEVVLVVMIAALIGFMIMNFPESAKLIGHSSYESTAKDVAAKQIEQLRSQGYDNLANGTVAVSDGRMSRLPSGAGTIVIEDCPITVCVNGELLKKVVVTITWNDGKKTQEVVVSTFIAQGGLK
jgi:prepilin-type N-terminal cleavage/methylation domain-containing protein